MTALFTPFQALFLAHKTIDETMQIMVLTLNNFPVQLSSKRHEIAT